MLQEEKSLLIKDLCARLPYGIKVCSPDKKICSIWNVPTINVVSVINGSGQSSHPIKDIKPYLRPMSSMTEEEQKEFGRNCGLWKREGGGGIHFINRLPNLPNEFADILISEIIMARAIDWLNEHHFDYRGLIEKGLALEAPEGMYN